MLLAHAPVSEAWQPQGHLYVWAKESSQIRCYEFGGPRPIYGAVFKHVHLPGDSIEEPASLFSAFVGEVTGQYIQGRTIIGIARKEDDVVGLN